MLLSSKAYNTHSCHLESNLASNFLSHKPLKQPSSSASLETGSRAFNHQCRSWFFFPSWFLRWGNCMCDPEVAVTRSSFGFLSFFLELFWVSRLQRWVLGWFSGVIGFWCVWFELEDLQWWLGFICREEGGRRRIALSPIFYRLRSIWKTRKIEVHWMELGALDPRTSIWSGPRVDSGQIRFSSGSMLLWAESSRFRPIQDDLNLVLHNSSPILNFSQLKTLNSNYTQSNI